ncbi:MAG: hypothetical protein EA400_05505 [Chromatiaceae bacterium]|nr:MAG: hypothetical protein EA400_05505 [Chromatiaceae bacterium]
MDRFTRNYSIVLGLVILLLLGLWIKSAWQPRVWELNRLLAADQQLASYPYQFRVRDLDDGAATLSSPRAFQIPVIRFIGIIHPELAALDQDDPRVVAAQQALIEHQQRALELVLAQPDVAEVRWALDVQWLADHGVQTPIPRGD